MDSKFPFLNNKYALVCRYGKSILYPVFNEIYSSRPEYEFITINKSAAEILSFCNGNNSVMDIVDKMAEIYNETFEQSCNFTVDFLQSCLEQGYISISDVPISANVRIVGNFDIISPINVCVEITKRCPLKCLHCYNDSGKAKGYEMTFSEVKYVLDTLQQLGVQKIMITGGEPTIRKDFCKIVKYACDRFVAVSVGSNGYLITNEMAMLLSECKKNLVVQISVDGTESHHNEIRGVPDSFEKAINAIKILREYKIAVTVASTLNQKNFSDMEEIADIVCNAGALQLSFAVTTNQGRARKNRLYHGIDLNCLFERAVKLKELYVNKGMYVQIDEEVPKGINTNPDYCGAGISQIAIRENGDVSPCLSFFYTYGNILTENATDIFQHRKVEMFHNLPRPNILLCGDCENLENCQNCPARAFDSQKQNCKWFSKFTEAIQKYEMDINYTD